MIEKIKVEKYNASDDSFELTSIYVKNGSKVAKGDVIFSVETSKADIDIESEFSGYIYFKVKLNDILSVGTILYLISKDQLKNYDSYFVENFKSNVNDSDIIISKKARLILEKENIRPEEINKSFIKEEDVIDFMNSKNNINDEITVEKILSKISSKPIENWIVIIGAGGGAKMCIDAINSKNEYNILGLLDDNKKIDSQILNCKVIGKFSFYNKLIELGVNKFVIAFGVISNRKKRFDLYKEMKSYGASFINLIHEKAIVEKSVELGEGNVILAGANVGSSAQLGNLNYINNSSIVSHDCKLKDNIHIAPGAVLASSINIGSNSLIGMNTTLFYGVSIGENVTINNGLILNTDVEDNDIIKNNLIK